MCLFSIIRVLTDMEALLSTFKISVALVNGDKLADLALKYELETSPSRDELLSTIVNVDTVLNELNTPVKIDFQVFTEKPKKEKLRKRTKRSFVC